MDIFDSPLGGTHEYRSEPASFDRPRFIKSAADATARWTQSTASGGDAWLKGIQQTTKPIVGAAIAQRGVMQANFTRATAPGGVWETRLAAVGDAGVKAAAQAKQGNYAAGVGQAAGKYQSAITKILAYEAAGLPAIYGMASGTTEAGVARASAWIRYMAAGRGSLGA